MQMGCYGMAVKEMGRLRQDEVQVMIMMQSETCTHSVPLTQFCICQSAWSVTKCCVIAGNNSGQKPMLQGNPFGVTK